jgi:hypothetical protein
VRGRIAVTATAVVIAALATAPPAPRPAVTKRHTVKRSAHKKFRSARHARAGKGRFKFKRHYPDLARY